MAEVHGTIVYLDEWLTMSARMAIWSGDRRWVERFDEAAPKLDAALAEAAELATEEVRSAMSSTTDEAHRDLVIMERQALAMAASGDLATARTLLNGPEFSYLKDVYDTGIEVFGQELKTLADLRAASSKFHAWMEAAGLGLGTVLLFCITLTVQGRGRLARTDPLTDLPNRSRLYEELEAALADTRPSRSYALLLIDLDRFKAANHAYGHPAGDNLLQLVAKRLRSLVRDEDLVARLGGDEFALVFSLDASDQPGSLNLLAQLARRIVGSLGNVFELNGGGIVQIGGSVGIALAQPGSADVSDLMYRADAALYRAKTEGRSCFRFFEQDLDAKVRSRALLEGELRKAIDNDAIVAHFQPLVELATRRIIGVEMLARWFHPTRGMVSPAEFIPIAEELGLIGLLTDRLLRQGCVAAASWPAHLTLACNVSPLQLRAPGLWTMICTILEDTNFSACRLELEITESVLVGSFASARVLLDQLKTLGVQFALDDFGTGYSSLRHLQTLPFDKLKIDAGFVGSMVANKESEKIVAAVVGLGHSLGLSIVAEGVETAETAALLSELGCDIGQGWFFGPPCSAEGIAVLVRSMLP